MRSCDTCPGNTDCAGANLHPVLKQVFALYARGITDKFEILFALGPESEKLLERFDTQVSSDCWSKAALLAIADLITVALGLENSDRKPDTPNDPQGNLNTQIRHIIATAVDAFERFPWAIPELVEQAPELYQAIVSQTADEVFAERISRRNFVKLCKEVAYR